MIAGLRICLFLSQSTLFTPCDNEGVRGRFRKRRLMRRAGPAAPRPCGVDKKQAEQVVRQKLWLNCERSYRGRCSASRAKLHTDAPAGLRSPRREESEFARKSDRCTLAPGRDIAERRRTR